MDESFLSYRSRIDSESDDERVVVRPRKPKSNRIVSDDDSFVEPRRVGVNAIVSETSASESSDDEEWNVVSTTTRRSILGVRRSDDDDCDSDEFVSADEIAVEKAGKPSASEDDSIVDIKTPNRHSVICVISDDDEDTTDTYEKKPDIVPQLRMIDKTYPNSRVRYVTNELYENEMKELAIIRSNMDKIKGLLQNMNTDALPDKGKKLNERLTNLKRDEKNQMEKLSNMIPDNESSKLSKTEQSTWDKIESGSSAVQPKMFGTKALSTHMAQQTLTLDRLRSLHMSLDSRPQNDIEVKPSNNLLTSLMKHQHYALSWLIWREKQSPRGGILADDMGLGKTLTMISLILYSKESDNSEHMMHDKENEWNYRDSGKLTLGGTLIVCPASLLGQWSDEVKRHCRKHSLKVIVHHGSRRESKTHSIAKFDMVITTYNIVRRDYETRGVLMRVAWKRAILDEAHIVRNYKSNTAQAVFSLVAYSRWCLTGTPVHNKDLDIFSLLKFLRCSPFDDIVLWKKWIDNKSTGGQERLATIMKSLMLRRTKIQLQEEKSLQTLPKKTIHYIDVNLSKAEMLVYQEVLSFSKTLFSRFLQQRSGKFGNLNDEKFSKLQEKFQILYGGREVKSYEILVLLLRLRQICCHPGLIQDMLREDELDSSTKENDFDMSHEMSKLDIEDENGMNVSISDKILNSDSSSLSSSIKKILRTSNPIFNRNKISSKIEAVLSCLKESVLNNNNEKAIIVSQWTSVLSIIEYNLVDIGVTCATLSGKIAIKHREQIVRDFNSPTANVRVLLLSLCAGGVGLNLIGGNHLFLVDLHWNPQLEAQAQDRIYRVGQTKDVNIYKFVSQNTVESTIKILQDKKLALAENVLTGAKRIDASKLSLEDLKLMFNMQ